MSGGVNNALAASSLGGAISQIYFGQITSGIPSNLYNMVTTSQASSGIANQYRCFYVKNNANGETIRNVKIWFETLNSDQDITIQMGLDPGGKNSTPTTIANENTAPSGVTFSQPNSRDFNALLIGKLNAGDYYPVWINRTTAAGAAQYHLDSFVVRVEGGSQNSQITVPDFGVAAVGSLSCSSVVAQQNINNIAAKTTNVPPLEQFVALGDLAAATTPTCWFNMTSNIDSITNIVLGNQEIYTEISGSAQPSLLNSYLNHYNLTVPYYSFNYGPVHFLIINTEILYVSGSPQYNFVNNDLINTSTNGNIFWTIVCYHQPMYNDSASGPADGTFVPTSLASTYHPLFDTYGVDLVLSGHAYNYQRTYPILYNSPTTPTAAVTGTSSYTNPGAPIMINVGTGGYQIDSTIPFTTPVPSWIAFTDNADFGYLWLAFTNSSSTCTGTFFNAGNIGIDTFSITKS